MTESTKTSFQPKCCRRELGCGCWIMPAEAASWPRRTGRQRTNTSAWGWKIRFYSGSAGGANISKIFGSASSAGIFDDVAKLVLDLVCRRASFPRRMVCKYLDDVCAAAAAGSTALHWLDTAFQEIARDLGVELAPRDDPEKSFGSKHTGCDLRSILWHRELDLVHPGGQAGPDLQLAGIHDQSRQCTGEGVQEPGEETDSVLWFLLDQMHSYIIAKYINHIIRSFVWFNQCV